MILCFIALVMSAAAGSLAENCITWAVRQRLTKGGRILFRRSIFAHQVFPKNDRGVTFFIASWLPHAAWVNKDGVIWQWSDDKPLDVNWYEDNKGWRFWLSILTYDGTPIKGDPIFGDEI